MGVIRDVDESSNSDSGSGRFMIPKQNDLAPLSVEQPSDTPPPSANARRQRRRRRKTKICLWSTLASLIFLVAVGLILAYTVFKVRRPVISVDSVTLQDINSSIGLFSGLFGGNRGVQLNLTLDVDVSIYNPNLVGQVKYDNTSARLVYRDEQVGEAPIPAGHMSPKQTVPLNLSLILMTDKFFSNSRDLMSDVIAGKLPLSTNTTMTGKVTVFHLFKFHVMASSWCNFTVFISNRSVSHQVCSYKAKL